MAHCIPLRVFPTVPSSTYRSIPRRAAVQNTLPLLHHHSNQVTSCAQAMRDQITPLAPDTCRLCWLYINDPSYRNEWKPTNGDTSSPGTRSPGSTCRHLGAPTGETTECTSCGGKVKLKLFNCATYGQCTVGKPVDGLACCVGCPSYEGTNPPGKDIPRTLGIFIGA